MVIKIPLRTEDPVLARASLARSTRLKCRESAKDRVIWEQNSTEIPTLMTRFTRETGLRLISRSYIMPNMLTVIISTVVVVMTAAMKLKFRRTKLTIKTATIHTERLMATCSTIVTYIS